MPVTVTSAPFLATDATSGSARRPSTGSSVSKTRRCSPPARATSPAGVSTARTRPREMTATRSHRRSTSSMKWVTSRTVTPRSLTLATRSHVSRRARGSRPVVSSSSIATRGLPTSASATDSRWRCPPDSLPKGARRSSPASSARARQSAGRE
nr:hypothetical protein [Microbispora sp. GKU 823]